MQEREQISSTERQTSKIAAGRITGRWQDKVNNLDGIVNGTVRADGFDILLGGNFFDAKMAVVNSPYQQSLTIVLEERSAGKETRCDPPRNAEPSTKP